MLSPTSFILNFFFFSPSDAPPHVLHSFPTRRSSDLPARLYSVAFLSVTSHRDGPELVDQLLNCVFASKPIRTWCQATGRSEEHTSELQSPYDLVCRLLLEKKKTEQCAP